MQQTHLIVFKHHILKKFGLLKNSFELHFVRLIDEGTDNIGLFPLIYLLFDQLIGPLPVAFLYQDSFNVPFTLRELINKGDLQIPVDGLRDTSGYGRSRHDQKMRKDSLILELPPLSHPKPVLLINYSQGQVSEGHVFLNQGVGPHHYVYLSPGHILIETLSLTRSQGTG
ncbi:MAG: hypothetical protein DDT18_01436 [Actinobacteria bacterium]|nr:hypothetical protein [Actinomycetota bacterium]